MADNDKLIDLSLNNPEGLGDRIAESMRQARTEREKRERFRYAPFNVKVGVCGINACNGDIEYRSEWVIAVSMSEMQIGGKNPMKEVCRCSCAKCGVLYDTSHRPFRLAFEEARQKFIDGK